MKAIAFIGLAMFVSFGATLFMATQGQERTASPAQVTTVAATTPAKAAAPSPASKSKKRRGAKTSAPEAPIRVVAPPPKTTQVV